MHGLVTHSSEWGTSKSSKISKIDFFFVSFLPRQLWNKLGAIKRLLYLYCGAGTEKDKENLCPVKHGKKFPVNLENIKKR